jgi:hypothetical protein
MNPIHTHIILNSNLFYLGNRKQIVGRAGTTIAFSLVIATGTCTGGKYQCNDDQQGKTIGFVVHSNLFGLKRLKLPDILQI